MRALLFSTFVGSIPFIVTILQFFDQWTDWIATDVLPTSKFSDGEVYDFIIVGAGTAGAVLGKRLSRHNTVLVMEAGGQTANSLTDIPSLAMFMLHSDIDYKYKTVPQNKSCLNLKDRVSLWPRGLALGGSSVLNYMVYIRGNKRDYDNWSYKTNSSEWNYENVLPFFKKSEDYSNGVYSHNKKYHGQGGELTVSDVSYSPLLDHFLRAGKELNYETIDLNAESQVGFGEQQVTQKRGARCSTFKAFLQPVMNRKNLHVLTYATAYKIHFDKTNRAVGIHFERHGKKRYASASKEIILSAGTLGSARLLMQSGIGRRDHLQNLKIKVRADLPVGDNLQDHPSALYGPILINSEKSFPERDIGLGAYYDYFVNGKGPLSAPSGLQGLGFVESSFAQKTNENYPDIQFSLLGIGLYSSITTHLANMVGVDKLFLDKAYGPNIGKDSFFILTTLVRPRSRGIVRLSSKNYKSPLIINPNYFDDENDLKILTDGLLIASKLKNTSAFQELGARLISEKPFSCEIEDEREMLSCYAQRYTATLYHPTSTCTMGRKDDPNSVVDPELRVLHTKGLRVIDGSIIPTIIAGNTQSPIIMIGEKDIETKFNYYKDYITSQFYDESTEVYDFIICGCGSSGSVISNRLSKNNKILVLEAGSSPVYHSSIPTLSLDLLGHPEYDYSYKTEKQKDSFALNDRVSTWPRGKVLGGSSTLNNMVYARSSPLDYDNWANITGDPSWKYENLVKYFRQMEDYNGKYKSNEKYYGSKGYGYLRVEHQRWNLLGKEFIEAGQEFGFEELDLNAQQRSGFGPVEKTQMNGQRHGGYEAFLKNFLHRKNLQISLYSQVVKIKLDKNNHAVGVWYIKHGVKKFVRAKKEIIISSGSIDSPKILMLSGMGPKKHLENLKIKVRANLPVGENLQDHLMVLTMPFILNQSVSFLPPRDMDYKMFVDYYLYGDGILTNPACMSGWSFMCSEKVKSTGIDHPDLQLFIFAFGVHEKTAEMLSKSLQLRLDVGKQMFTPYIGRDAVILQSTLGRPKSRGYIKLRDKNPNSRPIIQPNYLEHEDDVKALVESVKFTVDLVEKSKAFQQYGAYLSDIPLLGCEQHIFRSDSYYECFVRSLAMTVLLLFL